MLGGGLIGSSALTKTSAPTRCESQSPFRSVTSYALVHLVTGCGLSRLIPVRSDLRPVIRLCTIQVWQIDMRNEAGELTRVSRINTAVMAPKATLNLCGFWLQALWNKRKQLYSRWRAQLLPFLLPVRFKGLFWPP